MYDENGVTIPQKTAGLLLAAILSDTLVFRRPHLHPPIDVNAANRLAKIAGVDINEFANEMFEAGESWTARPPRKCSCRTSRCSCAVISALVWRRAAT
mgnify:CR=1 FL=1